LSLQQFVSMLFEETPSDLEVEGRVFAFWHISCVVTRTVSTFKNATLDLTIKAFPSKEHDDGLLEAQGLDSWSLVWRILLSQKDRSLSMRNS